MPLKHQYRHIITSRFMWYAKRDVETGENLFELFKEKKILKGAQFLTQGEQWDTFSIVVKGMFRLYYIDEDGREHTKGIFNEDRILAPCAPSAIGKPVNFSIETLEDTEILWANYQQMRAFLESTDWGKFVLIGLLETILNEKIEREYDWLILDAESRYLRFLSKNHNLSERIPLYVIANYLGMTDVTLSRIRRNLDLT